MSRLPLSLRRPDEPVFVHRCRPVSLGRLLHQACCVAEALPAGEYVINRCCDRYAFAVGFVAAAMSGRTSLLPPDRMDSTVQDLTRRYPDACVLADEAGAGGLDGVMHAALAESGEMDTVPRVAREETGCIVFTSGSTGPSKAIAKPWTTLLESSRINARALELDHHNLLATVPPQHMYGLETSILLPLFAPVAVSHACPFWPGDVAAELENLPEPRVLVSTPVHLRALSDGETRLGPLARVVSSTSPLEPGQAEAVETLHGTRLLEIYGCSETGCMARREPARQDHWTLFPEFEVSEDQGIFRAGADHLVQDFELQDRLEFSGSGTFRLAGRREDLVKVAGKRASLAELNRRLLATPGVRDGVIFEPPEAPDRHVPRLAALVVAPEMEPAEIRAALNGQIEPVFIPRPIVTVDHLPRSETGKLRRDLLADLLASRR